MTLVAKPTQSTAAQINGFILRLLKMRHTSETRVLCCCKKRREDSSHSQSRRTPGETKAFSCISHEVLSNCDTSSYRFHRLRERKFARR